MGQMGFFDLGNRYSGLDAKNEPLLKIGGVVPWEDLRARLEAVWRRAEARKSRAGRKPWDAIVMFKTILLCALYNLSDDQVEHQIRDRLSFMRFRLEGGPHQAPEAFARAIGPARFGGASRAPHDQHKPAAPRRVRLSTTAKLLITEGNRSERRYVRQG